MQDSAPEMGQSDKLSRSGHAVRICSKSPWTYQLQVVVLERMFETDPKMDGTQGGNMEYSAVRKIGDEEQSENKKHSDFWNERKKMTRAAHSLKRENDPKKTEHQSDW